jgi:hypothetical protein
MNRVLSGRLRRWISRGEDNHSHDERKGGATHCAWGVAREIREREEDLSTEYAEKHGKRRKGGEE